MQVVKPIVTPQTKVDEVDVKQLWDNSYPRSKFLLQLCLMLFTLSLWLLLVRKCIAQLTNPLIPPLSFIVSMLFVDWISGMLHWGCDTWGAFKTPVFGPTIIRSFRMHHVDPLDITRHGFVETNASSCYPMPLCIAIGLYFDGGTCLAIYHWTILFACVLGTFTNEIHKWAHLVHEKPNKIVQWLQKQSFILDPASHHIHHIDEFDRNYCITNGWMNPLLQSINYWRTIESIIHWVTGAVPRADDAFWRELKTKP